MSAPIQMRRVERTYNDEMMVVGDFFFEIEGGNEYIVFVTPEAAPAAADYRTAGMALRRQSG